MKQFSLVLTGGKTMTYNKSDIADLEDAYEGIKSNMENNTFFVIKTDDGKDETLVNTNHLIGINAQYN